jgi:hypothetical protein
LALLDNGRELLVTDVIADFSCLTLKKTEEPASRRFARDLYQAYVDGEKKGREEYGNMPWYQRRKAGTRQHGNMPCTYPDDELEEEEKKIQKLEEEEKEKKTGRPKFERQRSMFGDRKDKAREEMKADWSWQDNADVQLYKQVQDWCKAQLPQEKQEPAPSHKESNKSSAMEAPEGTVLVASKEDQAEFGIAPTAKHKSHKHHKNKKGAGHGATHNVQSLKLFASLNLSVPATPEECLKIVEDMEARLAAHHEEEEQRRQKEVEYWTRKRDEADYWRGTKERGGDTSRDAWPRWEQNVNVWSWGPTWGKKVSS